MTDDVTLLLRVKEWYFAPRTLPRFAELEERIRSQHVGDVRMQALGILLLEEYAAICGLRSTCEDAVLFKDYDTPSISKYLEAIETAEQLAGGILEQLRTAGFDIPTAAA